jgi:hypothetical protein
MQRGRRGSNSRQKKRVSQRASTRCRQAPLTQFDTSLPHPSGTVSAEAEQRQSLMLPLGLTPAHWLAGLVCGTALITPISSDFKTAIGWL